MEVEHDHHTCQGGLLLLLQAQSFTLEEDTSGYTPYERGGIVTQFKEAKKLHFKPLAEALTDPGEFLLSDFSKMEVPVQLHIAFQALDKFEASNLLCKACGLP